MLDETNVLWLEAGYIGPSVSYSSRDCDLPGDILIYHDINIASQSAEASGSSKRNFPLSPPQPSKPCLDAILNHIGCLNATGMQRNSVIL